MYLCIRIKTYVYTIVVKSSLGDPSTILFGLWWGSIPSSFGKEYSQLVTRTTNSSIIRAVYRLNGIPWHEHLVLSFINHIDLSMDVTWSPLLRYLD